MRRVRSGSSRKGREALLEEDDDDDVLVEELELELPAGVERYRRRSSSLRPNG